MPLFSRSDVYLKTPPMTLGDLIDMIENGYIEFETDYQREPDLWSQKRQSRLIESILLGLPLPAFYFDEVAKNNWRIIDGLQRCSAIRNFCVDKSLKLDGLEFLTHYSKAYYDKLSFNDRRELRMLPITVNLLGAGTPDDVKYVLYKRLNTGGMPLTSQEIRNAVFYGKAIDIVAELSRSPEFLEATSNKIPTRRQQAMDFVSRFMAFYLIGYENYDVSDLDRFINRAMSLIKNGMVDSELPQMKEDFKKAMLAAKEIFGDDAFRKRLSDNDRIKPINKAYFEITSVGLSRLNPREMQNLLSRKDSFRLRLMREMKSNQGFINSLSGGTAKVASVRKRFSTFEEILKDYIHD